MHTHKKKILVVDDNEANRLVAGLMLEMLGFTYDEVCSGRLALDRIAKNHYDAILMDVQMPELDGLETTRRIRIREKDHNFSPMPIIATTADTAKIHKRKCIDAGMNGFMVKPYTSTYLAEMIKAHVH
jgi:CheY-like chemotaxis protein